MKRESDILKLEIQLTENVLEQLKNQQRYTQVAILNSTLKEITDTYRRSTFLEKLILQTIQIIDTNERKNQKDNFIDRLEELPEKDQMEGAFDGLFLLHETYNLNLTDLFMGDITPPGPVWDKDVINRKIKSSFECSPTDLEFLAKHSYNRDYFDRAYEFIKAAEKKAKTNAIVDENELKRVKKTMAVIKRDHDVTLLRKGAYGSEWRTFRLPFSKKLAANNMFKNVKSRHHHVTPKILNELPYPFLSDLSNIDTKRTLKEQFKMLCRGERIRPFDADKSLRSFYLHHNQSYLKLGPFKLETRNEAPFLAIFRDFFYEQEMSHFIEYAHPKLERSNHLKVIASNKDDSFGSSRSRTSKQAWVEDISESSPISRRISVATFTNTSSIYTGGGAEPFQVKLVNKICGGLD